MPLTCVVTWWMAASLSHIEKKSFTSHDNKRESNTKGRQLQLILPSTQCLEVECLNSKQLCQWWGCSSNDFKVTEKKKRRSSGEVCTGKETRRQTGEAEGEIKTVMRRRWMFLRVRQRTRSIRWDLRWRILGGDEGRERGWWFGSRCLRESLCSTSAAGGSDWLTASTRPCAPASLRLTGCSAGWLAARMRQWQRPRSFALVSTPPPSPAALPSLSNAPSRPRWERILMI